MFSLCVLVSLIPLVKGDGLACLLDPDACVLFEALENDPDMKDWATCSKTLDHIDVDDFHLPIMDVLELPDAMAGHQAAVKKSKLWPNNQVPVRLQPGMTISELKRIACAVMFFHEKTCVRFVRHKPSDADFLTIKKSHPNSEGCFSSALGVKGGEQIVLLDETYLSCWKHGVIVHELMHALGFFHEQSRNDRDNFVTVHWEVIPSHWKRQFLTASQLGIEQQMVGEYDYKSVMHYPRFLPHIPDPAMTALEDPVNANNAAMGQRNAPTKLDAFKINTVYGCPKDRDCRVSGWSEWSRCGGGLRTRQRKIQEQPTGKGDACPNLTESVACNTNNGTDHTKWVLISSRYNWPDARSHCFGRGGDLVSIHNRQQYEHALSLNPPDKRWSPKHWSDKFNWVGGLVAGGWKWTDGTEVQMWGWANGQPAREGVTHLSINSKGWFDYSYSTKLRFICTV